MRLALQKILNDFIDRDFAVDEMAEVLTDISEYEKAKTICSDKRRYDTRDYDFEWLDKTEEFLKTTLKKYDLKEYEEDLL